MTTVLGVRCWADRYSYVVLTGSPKKFTVKEAKHVKLPVNDPRGAQLASLRQDVVDLLRQHGVSSVCYKQTEPLAKKKDMHRGEVEGVLLEATYAFDPTVPVTPRIIKQLKSALKFPGKAPDLVTLFDVSEFDGLSKANFSDAAIAALSALT